MERELWKQLSRAISDVARSHTTNAYHGHSHADIVRVYLWSVLHDRPASWACHAEHWDHRTRPKRLPSQPTLSRRLRTAATQRFLHALGRRLSQSRGMGIVLCIDGKAFTIAKHSKDPDASFGPAHGRTARGYKLHAIWGHNAMPDCWELRPLSHNEKNVAHELIPKLQGAGYLLGDGFYHANRLFRRAAEHGRQLLAPRAHPGTHIRQPKRFHPARLRCVATLEADPFISGFARQLFKQRKQIEAHFGHLTSFGGGLTCLPPWVRRLHRVRLYVHAKLLINAARIRCIRA